MRPRALRAADSDVLPHTAHILLPTHASNLSYLGRDFEYNAEHALLRQDARLPMSPHSPATKVS